MVKKKDMSLAVLCDIAKQNTTASRNITKTCKVYDCLLSSLIDACTSDTERKCIIDTFIYLSNNSNFRKQFTMIPTVAKDLKTCFYTFPMLQNEITQLVINICPSLFDDDIDKYIMPILSICRLSNDAAINLFREILTTKRLSEKSVHKNMWIFSELQVLLETSDKRNEILQIIHLILLNGYATVRNFMRKGIWSSTCRNTLINLVLNNDFNVSGYAQCIILDILRFIPKSTLNLSEEYIHKIRLSLKYQNTCCFGIYVLHSLRRSDIHDILQAPDIHLLSQYLQSWQHKDCLPTSVCIVDILMSWLQEFDYDTQFSPLLRIIKNVIHTTHAGKYEQFDFYNQIEGDTTKMSRYIKLAKEIGVPEYTISKTTDELDFLLKHDDGMRNLKQKGLQIEVPNEFKCPITCDVMRQPVVASDGHSYEHEALKLFFQKGNGKSPLTRQKLDRNVMLPNINLKKRIREYADNICEIVDKQQRS